MFTITKTSAFWMMTACALAGCVAPDETISDEAIEEVGQDLAAYDAPGGAAYAMTNQQGNNAIVVYKRAQDGALVLTGVVPTGGGGSGVQLDPVDSLGSQGSLVLDRKHRYLFAVNTETVSSDNDCHQGSISVFRIAADGALTAVGAPVPSGGLYPDSMAVRGHTLFVLNSGGPDACAPAPGFEPYPNVTGFRIGAGGALTRIAGATKLVNPGVGPAPDTCAPAGFAGGSPQFDCGLNPPAFPRSPGQVAFTPDGESLVVSVKGTNSIHVLPFEHGELGDAVVTRAPGASLPTYFGFGFDRHGNLIVSEPFGSATSIPAGGASALSSFRIAHDGHLIPQSTSVANGETATCWVAIDPRTGKYAYTANNGTNSISVYSIAGDGALTHLAGATEALPGEGDELAHPNELATALDRDEDGHPVSYLYSMNSGTGMIGMFRIQADGALDPLGEIGGLPADAGAQGLVAF